MHFKLLRSDNITSNSKQLRKLQKRRGRACPLFMTKEKKVIQARLEMSLEIH